MIKLENTIATRQAWRDSKKSFTDFINDLESYPEGPSMVQIDEDIFDHFLECVPPIMKGKKFLCGEIYNHVSGVAVYMAFEKIGGNYYYRGLRNMKFLER